MKSELFESIKEAVKNCGKPDQIGIIMSSDFYKRFFNYCWKEKDIEMSIKLGIGRFMGYPVYECPWLPIDFITFEELNRK